MATDDRIFWVKSEQKLSLGVRLSKRVIRFIALTRYHFNTRKNIK